MSKTAPKISGEPPAKIARPKRAGKGRTKLAPVTDEPKSSRIAKLLTRPGGATIAEMMKMTGWQAHSVRGFLSGALKKRKGLPVSGQRDDAGVMRYRIADVEG
jgi:Protein of unknown function (DUF3489)